MKKLLSILAVVGLTATASSSVIACSSSKTSEIIKNVKAYDGKIQLNYADGIDLPNNLYVKPSEIAVDVNKKLVYFNPTVTLPKGTVLLDHENDSNDVKDDGVYQFDAKFSHIVDGGDQSQADAFAVLEKPIDDVKDGDVLENDDKPSTDIPDLQSLTMIVSKDAIGGNISHENISDDNPNALVTAKDLTLKVTAVLDISKAINDDAKNIDWTIITLHADDKNGGANEKVTVTEKLASFKVDLSLFNNK